MRKFGIDISKWQGADFPIENVGERYGVEFAILRAAYGNSGDIKADPLFDLYYSRARRGGIQVGAYFYTYTHTVEGIRDDAKAVIDLLGGRRIDTPIYLDMEEPFHCQAVRREINTQMVLAWCDELEKAGYLGGVYSFASFFKSFVDDQKLEGIPHWVAHYNDELEYSGPGPLYMWQYCVDKMHGIDVDHNYMFINCMEMLKEQGLNGYRDNQQAFIDYLASEIRKFNEGRWNRDN